MKIYKDLNATDINKYPYSVMLDDIDTPVFNKIKKWIKDEYGDNMVIANSEIVDSGMSEITGIVAKHYVVYFFKKEEDAIGFKLKWS